MNGEQWTPLLDALAYAYVRGWYAGGDGVRTDDGKIAAAREEAAKIPEYVAAPRFKSQRDALLAACKEALAQIELFADAAGEACGMCRMRPRLPVEKQLRATIALCEDTP